MSVPQADVFVHHTADGGPPGGVGATRAQEAAYMRDVEAFHINSREMRAIAYSFVVMPSGRIYEGRGWGKDGGHTACCNTTSHAICFAGNFQSMKPTEAAIETARGLIVLGQNKGMVTASPRIRGHRDAPGASTACPGNNLYARLDEIRNLDAGGDDMGLDEYIAGETAFRQKFKEVGGDPGDVNPDKPEHFKAGWRAARFAGNNPTALVPPPSGPVASHTHNIGAKTGPPVTE